MILSHYVEFAWTLLLIGNWNCFYSEWVKTWWSFTNWPQNTTFLCDNFPFFFSVPSSMYYSTANLWDLWNINRFLFPARGPHEWIYARRYRLFVIHFHLSMTSCTMFVPWESWEFYCDVAAGAAYFSVARTKVGTFEWELIISPAFYNVILFRCYCCCSSTYKMLPLLQIAESVCNGEHVLVDTS